MYDYHINTIISAGARCAQHSVYRKMIADKAIFTSGQVRTAHVLIKQQLVEPDPCGRTGKTCTSYFNLLAINISPSMNTVSP